MHIVVVVVIVVLVRFTLLQRSSFVVLSTTVTVDVQRAKDQCINKLYCVQNVQLLATLL